MVNSINRIVVHVAGSETARSAVETAGRLAESFDASLLGIHAVGDAAVTSMAPMPGATLSPVAIEDLRRQSEERAKASEEMFRAVVDKHNWNGQWRCADQPNRSARDQVAYLAHFADFVVADQGDPEDTSAPGSSVAADLIVDSGRPVIVQPRGWSGQVGEESVLFAWKPCREAARAVHDAMPFLERAKKVTVTSVTSDELAPPNEDNPGAVLAQYLNEHGIDAKSKPLFGIAAGDTAETLMAQANGMGADLLVLGGYSHSRLREGIFGGITQSVVENTKVPALLSH
jgi:nucleotide-binding universal stress UspA family protein